MAAPQTQTITEKDTPLLGIDELGFTHPDGKRFSYWTTNRDGTGERFYDCQKTTITQSITLYAQWGMGCTVNWDANGGAAVSPSTVTIGEAVGTLPTTTRSEYVFNNWWTAKTGGTKVTSGTYINEDVTFYAHWTGKVRTFNPSSLPFDDGYPSSTELMFSNVPKGKYSLVIDKMDIIHSGGKSWHSIWLDIKVENPSNTRQYTYLPMSSTNTQLVGNPSGVHYATRNYNINGSTKQISQLYATGHEDGGGTGYFKSTTVVNLPYAKNKIYIQVDPSDRDNCSGGLYFNSNAKITLTKID